MGTSVIAFLEAYLITGTPLTLWILIMRVIHGNWSIKNEALKANQIFESIQPGFKLKMP